MAATLLGCEDVVWNNIRTYGGGWMGRASHHGSMYWCVCFNNVCLCPTLVVCVYYLSVCVEYVCVATFDFVCWVHSCVLCFGVGKLKSNRSLTYPYARQLMAWRCLPKVPILTNTFQTLTRTFLHPASRLGRGTDRRPDAGPLSPLSLND